MLFVKSQVLVKGSLRKLLMAAPKVVKEGASKDEAEDIKTKLEAEGAKVTLK